MSKKVNVYSKVGNFKAQLITTCKNQSEANKLIERYERQDRYERDVEGYGFPHGMPEYFTA